MTSRTTPEFDLFPAAATLDKLTPSQRGASTKCAAAGIRHVSLWPAPPEILAPSEREINTVTAPGRRAAGDGGGRRRRGAGRAAGIGARPAPSPRRAGRGRNRRQSRRRSRAARVRNRRRCWGGFGSSAVAVTAPGGARRDERFARCFGRADRSARQINMSIDGDGMTSACRDEMSGHKLSQDRWSTVAFGARDAVLFRLGLIEARSHFHRTRTDQPSSRNSA